METVTIHVAKTRRSQLLARVEAGEEIALARGKQPIAKLVPYVPAPVERQFGALRGIVTVGPEFFEPLPAEETAAWEQRRAIVARRRPLESGATAIADQGNGIFISAASAWEITTKHRIGKLPGVAAIVADLDAGC